MSARARGVVHGVAALLLAGALAAAGEPPTGLVVVVPAASAPVAGDLLAGTAVVHALVADAAARTAWQAALAPLAGMAVVEERADLARLPYAERSVRVLRVADWAGAARRGLTAAEVMRVGAPGARLEIVGADAQLADAAKVAGIALGRDGAAWRRGREAGLADAAVDLRVDAGNRRASDDLLLARQEDPFMEGRLGEEMPLPVVAVRDRLPALWPRWNDGLSRPTGRGGIGGLVAAGGRMFSRSGAEITAWQGGRARAVTVARDLASGVPLWSSPAPERLIGADDATLVATDQQGLVGLDAASGAPRWRGSVRLGPATDSLALVPGLVVLAGSDRVTALATADGRERWTRPLAASLVVVAGDHVLLAVADGVVALALADGAQRWRCDAARLAGMSLVCASAEGVIIASTHTVAVLDLADGSERLRTRWKAPPRYWPAKADSARAVLLIESGHLIVRESRTARALPLAGGAEKALEPGLLGVGFGAWSCNSGGTLTTGLLRHALGLLTPEPGSAAPWIGHMPASGTCGYGSLVADRTAVTLPMGCTCGGMWGRPRGLVALSPAPADVPATAFTTPGDLVRGPAWGRAAAPLAPGGWPCLRGDQARSAATSARVPARPALAWRTPLAGPVPAGVVSALSWRSRHHHPARITPPVAAGGLVAVGLPEDHAAAAVALADGKPRWRFRADGAIDSPPTLALGRAWVGSRDGWLSCLELADGQAVWRRRVAPVDRRVVMHGMLESLWPVTGAVSVVGDRVHATAGWAGTLGVQVLTTDAAGAVQRYRALPRGVYWNDALVADAAGELRLGVARLADGWDPRDPAAGKPPSGDPPGARWMPRLGFGVGNRSPGNDHLLGLDCALIDVTRSQEPGLGAEAGVDGFKGQGVRCLLLGGRQALHWTWDATRRIGVRPLPFGVKNPPHANGPLAAWPAAGGEPTWSRDVGTIWALALAGDTVLAAGPTAAAGATAGTGRLWLLDAATGAERSAIDLPAPPAQDGLAVVDGAVLVSLIDGSLCCLR